MSTPVPVLKTGGAPARQAVTTADATVRSRRLILFTCCLALFIGTLDNAIANLALPGIHRSFGARLSQLQWSIDAYVLARAALQFGAGVLADVLGRRRLFQAGLIIFGLGSLSSSLAPSIALLITFRAIQGVGAAMMTPASLAIVAATFTDPVVRARAVGRWSATIGASMAAGPVLGGALVQLLGWRSIFWINVPVVILALILTERVIVESRGGEDRRLDLAGQALLLVSLASVAYALIEAPSSGWTAVPVLVVFAVSALSSIAFVGWERRRTDPLVDLSAFRAPSFSGSAVLGLIAFLILSGFLFINSLYLEQTRGLTPVMVGVLTVPATAFSLVASPISGAVVARVGVRPPLIAGFTCLLGGLLALSRMTITTSIAALACAYGLVGLGIGLANPAITLAAMAGMPTRRAGVAAATTTTARQIGNVLGVALLGSLALHPLEGGSTTVLPNASATSFTVSVHLSYLVAAGLSVVAIVVAVTAMRGGTGPERNA